jgi:hypothetical protein
MTKTAHIRELARRRDAGIEVALRWHPETDTVSITVDDDQTGESHEIDVEKSDAMDAYTHPFAYLKRR